MTRSLLGWHTESLMELLAALIGLAGREVGWNKPVDFQRALAEALRGQGADVNGPSETAANKLPFLDIRTLSGIHIAIGTFYKHRFGTAPTDRLSSEFFRGLALLENMTAHREIDEGHLVFVSNDSKVWADSDGKAIFDEFRLSDGRRVLPGRIDWGKAAAPTSKPRGTDNLRVTGEYKISWQPFGDEGFRYLLLTAGGDPPLTGLALEEKSSVR